MLLALLQLKGGKSLKASFFRAIWVVWYLHGLFSSDRGSAEARFGRTEIMHRRGLYKVKAICRQFKFSFVWPGFLPLASFCFFH